MNDFINKPSKDALIDDVNLANEIIKNKNNGYKIKNLNGAIWLDTGSMSRQLGTITNIAELSKELFGDKIPDGVEYVTLGEFTFMTYKGKLLAVGDGSGLGGSGGVVHKLNDIINHDLTAIVGNFIDLITMEDIYNKASKGIAFLDEILMLCSDPEMNNYNNTLNIISNLANISGELVGTKTVIDTYAATAMNSILTKLLAVLQADLLWTEI